MLVTQNILVRAEAHRRWDTTGVLAVQIYVNPFSWRLWRTVEIRARMPVYRSDFTPLRFNPWSRRSTFIAWYKIVLRAVQSAKTNLRYLCYLVLVKDVRKVNAYNVLIVRSRRFWSRGNLSVESRGFCQRTGDQGVWWGAENLCQVALAPEYSRASLFHMASTLSGVVNTSLGT